MHTYNFALLSEFLCMISWDDTLTDIFVDAIIQSNPWAGKAVDWNVVSGMFYDTHAEMKADPIFVCVCVHVSYRLPPGLKIY